MAQPLLVSLCALAWLATPAHAGIQRFWTGGVSANWSEPQNWNPAGVPQNGDELEFDGNGANRTMDNDLVGLSCDLDFLDGVDYTLVGNSVKVGLIQAAVVSVFAGSSQTITFNCPLVFASGGTIDLEYGVGPQTGEDKSFVHLNGGVTVQSGTLFLHAEGDSGRSGHIYVAGALAGAGDVKAEADEHSGTAGSIEFDSQLDSTNYTATLWVSTVGSAQVVFNQSPGAMVSRHVGVHQGDTADLVLNQANQNQTQLWIDPGSTLYLDGNNATFLGVFMVATSNELAAPYLGTVNGVLLGLNGQGIAVHSDDNAHTPDIVGRLNFNGINPIDVYGTATVGLEIPANIGGDGFNKIGNCTLLLNGLANTYTGTASVNQGVLDVQSSSALGSPGAQTVLNGGSLTLRAPISGVTLIAATQGASAGNPDLPGASLVAISPTPVVWSGPVVLNTNLDVFGQDMTFGGAISGAGGLGFFNLGTGLITGVDTNTFTGEMLVRCPLVELDKPADIPALSGGPLVVGGGFGGPYELRWLNSYQDGINQELIVYANGLVNLNNYSDWFSYLTFNGGELDTGSGVLSVGGQVWANANSATASLNGNVALAGVAPVLGADDGPAEPDLLVNAVLSGTLDHITKSGAGSVALTSINNFSASINVQQGTLEVDNSGALGNPGNLCEVFSGFGGATLSLALAGSLPNPLEVAGSGAYGTNGAIAAAAGNACTLAGPVAIGGPVTLNVDSAASLAFSGVISGNGSLTKNGSGALTLSGPSPNTFSGDLTNRSGLLYLAKSGSSPIAIPANLVLGPAPANAAAMAMLLSANSIAGAVTVNANSSLNLNGRSQTLAQLNLNDGGGVQTGSGVLLLASGATVNVGSLNTRFGGGSHVSSSIQGNLDLTANGSPVQFAVRSYAISYPFDARAELELPGTIGVNGPENPNLAPAGIAKSGSGRMRLSGTNTFLGGTTINGGTLQLDGSLPLGGYVSVENGGTLKGVGRCGRLVMLGSSGAVAPGNGPGILNCYNIDALGSGFAGVLNPELNGVTPGSQYDQLVSAGVVNLTGLTLAASLGYTPTTGDQFTIVVNNGNFPVSGTFSGLPEGAALPIGGELFHITYRGGDGNDVVLTAGGKVTYAAIVWTNTAGGNWSNPTNWSPNLVPGQLNGAANLDDAWITNGGTYTVVMDEGTPPDNWDIHNVVLGAGVSNGVQTLSLTGKMLSANSVTITDGGVLADNGSTVTGAVEVQNSGQLNSVNGTYYGQPLMLLAGGQMTARGHYADVTLHGQAVVGNGGGLTVVGDTDGRTTVANDGVLIVTNGGQLDFQNNGRLDLYGPLTNSGAINLDQASVELHNDGTAANQGLLQNLPGGTVNLTGGIASGSISTALNAGPDDLFLNQGSVINVTGGNSILVSQFDTSAGVVTNLAGTLALSGFTGTLAGVFDAATGATIQLNGGTGNAPLTPGTPLLLAGGGNVQFLSGWLDLPTNIVPNLQLLGGVLELENTFQGGAITNLALDGTTLTNAPGTVWPVTNGTFSVTDSAVYGGLVVEPGAQLQAVRDFRGTPTFFGEVTVQTGGTLTANGVFEGKLAVNGICNITGGAGTSVANGSLTVAAGGTLNLGYNLQLNSPLTNSGTINLGSSTLLLENDGVNSSGGLVNAAGGQLLLPAPGGGGVARTSTSSQDYFLNQGTVLNSASAGSLNVTGFTNYGALISDEGTLNLNQVTLEPSGRLLAGLNSPTDYGKLAITGNAALTGAVGVRFNNGFQPSYGQSYTILSYGSYSGSFSGYDLSPLFDWQPTYGATAFSLTVQRELAVTALDSTRSVLSVSVAPGTQFVVLSSTNLLTPLPQWTPLVTNTEDATGSFTVTNTAAPGQPQQFFRLRFP